MWVLIKPKRGPRKDFTKRHREDGIAELQNLAEQILRKDVVPGRLKAITAGTRRTMLGGRGIEERFKRMCVWAEQNLHGPIIYSFWRGKRCLYVGMTCPPKTDPSAMRVPTGPGWALETLDETDTTHP